MSVTVYTKPGCVQCEATTRALTKAGITYQLVDLTIDTQALEQIKTLGHRQVPVVLADGASWSGFRPDRIKALVGRS